MQPHDFSMRSASFFMIVNPFPYDGHKQSPLHDPLKSGHQISLPIV